MNRIKEITQWETEDGKVFSTFECAVYHQSRQDLIKIANDKFESGSSLADAFRILGTDEDDIDPILEKVTKNTKLVIPYWQCRVTPGYQPKYFNTNGILYVHGDAGSYTGSYGGEVSITSLVRYAMDERTIL